jgi:hypothetical protein
MEILSKWEEANNKIFEKHPNNGEGTDFSILEAAADEMIKKKPKLGAITSAETSPDRGTGAKTKSKKQ